ncbi:MAG: PhzF family phenazine biosynthesis protein [Candidatus Xenobiia bacterium LiM19]
MTRIMVKDGELMKIYQVDAFTNSAFSGNPAAVCIPAEKKSDRWMSLVAAEMNLSETAFLERREDGFSLRWFTPAMEVNLCGHATLASAHILWERGFLQKEEPAVFHTKSGVLRAALKGEWIELDFPLLEQKEISPPAGLREALGVDGMTYVGESSVGYLIELAAEESVKSLRPDFAKLCDIGGFGFMVTSTSKDEEIDFVSRYFAPLEGIPEDPVTGSAHCCLAPYWMKKLGRNELTAFQASSRGGIVKVRVEKERVFLRGQAVTVLEGELLHPALED